MKAGSLIILFLILFCSSAVADDSRPGYYRPDGNSVVTVDGDRRFNRALYGAHSGFRIECSDTPEFGIYLPRMGGNLTLTLPPGSCTARYTPGRMDYSQGGVEVEVQVGRESDMVLWRLTNRNSWKVSIPIIFGGVSDKRFHRDGDLGVDAPDCFSLKPEYCTGNIFSVRGDTVTVEYGAKDRKILSLIIPSISYCISDLPSYEGVMEILPGQQIILGLFPTGTIPERSLESLLDHAEENRESLVSGIMFDTPALWLNPIGGALSVAADGIWSGQTWLHGAVGWRTPHLGWRGAYTGDAIGRHDRALTHFITYAENQITDIPPVFSHPCQDSTLNLARAEKRWGTPFYSNGYICRRPGRKDEMSHYDMNLVYIDALLRHFRHTGDTVAMRSLFPVIKRHLEWEKRNTDPDGDHLYDAYCCIWASDALYYSGGAVTHSTAYNLFANRLTALVAETIGEDPQPYITEADQIAATLDSVLWIPERGHWAEYREASGLRRLHPAAALWTIYHAIDSEVTDPFKTYSATCYIDSMIPHIPVKGDNFPNGLFTLSTTSWQPYSWSINNVAVAEVLHTALAYWLAGRNDEAFRLMEAVAADNMYLGASPLNFGQISHYDAARGECYRDFADAIGVWSRALTEGLFGIRPDLLSRERIVRIIPGFPSSWDNASVSLPNISYSYKRTSHGSIYQINNNYPEGAKIQLTVPAAGLDKVFVNGHPAHWTIPLSIGTPRITIDAGYDRNITIEIIACDNRPISTTGRIHNEGPVRFYEMSDGKLTWWMAETSPAAYDNVIPDTNRFDSILPSLCETVKLHSFYNAKVTDIFRNRYLTPALPVTTLRIPVQGIGEWCHPEFTVDIDDTGLRKRIEQGGGILTTETGIPFSLPRKDKNIIFTSLWDNYPDSVNVKVSGAASHIYLLLAGSTNHMQYGIENGSIRIYYKDGYSESVPLINPYNWVPIELDLYTDDHAFSRPAECPLPYRLLFSTGQMTRTPGKHLGLTGVSDRIIKGGAGIVLDIPADPARELESLTLETLSGDVVIGLMGLTLQRPSL